MSASHLGATRQEWDFFSSTLRLTKELLPVVSDISTPISPTSTLSALGKTPSLINGDGFARGMKDWTQLTSSPADIDLWSADPRLGICLQTRFVRAFDIDVLDPGLALKIATFITDRLGPLPTRSRKNSSKLLMAFTAEGDFRKQSFLTEHGPVEFLATGNQFIAAGTHTSGVKYEWNFHDLEDFPEFETQDILEVWQEIVEEFGNSSVTQASVRQREPHRDLHDPQYDWLKTHYSVFSETPEALYLPCPFEHTHSSPHTPSDTSTAYFKAGSNGYSLGRWKCMHAHCAHKHQHEFETAVGFTEERKALDTKDFEAVLPSQDTSTKVPNLRFQPIPASTFSEATKANWLIKNILPANGLAFTFGESGSGKSFFAIDLAFHVAQGLPWNNQRTTKGRVVYVCAEGSNGFRKRLRAYAKHHGINLQGLDIHVIPDVPNILDEKDVTDLVKAIGKADLVILDTFAQTTAGGNENSGEDMGLAIKNCQHIAASSGGTLLLIHHSGKDATRGMRGWSGIKAAADVELEVIRLEDGRKVKVSKQKDEEDGLEWAFELKRVTLGLDSDGDEVTSCVFGLVDGMPVGERASLKKDKAMGENEVVVLQLFDLAMKKGEFREVDGRRVVTLNDMVRMYIRHTGAVTSNRPRRTCVRSLTSLAARGRFKFDGEEIYRE